MEASNFLDGGAKSGYALRMLAMPSKKDEDDDHKDHPSLYGTVNRRAISAGFMGTTKSCKQRRLAS